MTTWRRSSQLQSAHLALYHRRSVAPSAAPVRSALAAILDADIRTLDAPAQDADGGPAYFETTFRLSRIVRGACSNDRMAEILGFLGAPDVAVQPTRPCHAGPAQRVGAQLANRAKGFEVGHAGGRSRRCREADRGFVPRGGQATSSRRRQAARSRRLRQRASPALPPANS
jgi:hypothetical protein